MKTISIWPMTLVLVLELQVTRAHANPADDYLSRKAQAEAIFNARMALNTQKLGVPCYRVIAHFGGAPPLDGSTPIIAVLCEMCDGARVLYEVLPAHWAADGKDHVRVATPEQISDDNTTMNQGFGLAGTWWKGENAKPADSSAKRQNCGPNDLGLVRDVDAEAATRIAKFCKTNAEGSSTREIICRDHEVSAWRRLVLGNEFHVVSIEVDTKCKLPQFSTSFVAKETCLREGLNAEK